MDSTTTFSNPRPWIVVALLATLVIGATILS
jgi:hypothetical protein